MAAPLVIISWDIVSRFISADLNFGVISTDSEKRTISVSVENSSDQLGFVRYALYEIEEDNHAEADFRPLVVKPNSAEVLELAFPPDSDWEIPEILSDYRRIAEEYLNYPTEEENDDVFWVDAHKCTIYFLINENIPKKIDFRCQK